MAAREVTFIVYGEAAPAGSKTIAKAGNRTWIRDASKKSYPWKQAVSQVAMVAMSGDEIMSGALYLEVTFFRARPKGHYGKRGLLPSAPEFPITKPDTTKTLRAVEDALTGIVWRDDAQIVEQHVRKQYGDPPRAEITVRTFQND